MSLRLACALVVLTLGGLALAQDPPAAPPAGDTPKTVTPPPPPTKVKIIVNTTPRKRAWVYHGRKKLGLTPLELDLPYNSGPRDVVVKAKGFLTVNTRLYTLKDEKVIVSLTREEDAHLLFGYREKIPPDGGVPESPDAGVAAPAVTPPAEAAPAPQPTATPTEAPAAPKPAE